MPAHAPGPPGVTGGAGGLLSLDGAAFANNLRRRLAVDPRCGGCRRDRRGRYRPVNGRFFSGGSAPLPVVRRSAGWSFATDSYFRLRRKRAHSVGLALPPASGGDANYGTSLLASTSLIRRSPLRLHGVKSISLGGCLVHPQQRHDPIHAGASRSTMNRYWPCWSKVRQAPALRQPATARWRCRPACG
jgi:hypothetical protein